jgi:hypothetical protein
MYNPWFLSSRKQPFIGQKNFPSSFPVWKHDKNITTNEEILVCGGEAASASFLNCIILFFNSCLFRFFLADFTTREKIKTAVKPY